MISKLSRSIQLILKYGAQLKNYYNILPILQTIQNKIFFYKS